MPVYSIIKGAEIFSVHVVDDQGMPHTELTLYANKARDHHSPRTALTYTRELTAFASWAANDPIALRQGWSLMGACTQVRNLVTHFLTSQLKCVVALREDKLGFETRRIEPSWGTEKRSLSHLLAALSSFYRIMHRMGRYGPKNPMQGDNATKLIAQERRKVISEFTSRQGRPPMPSVSGVDDVRFRRSNASYFRSSSGDWMPKAIDDPTLQNTVLSAGERWGWKHREISMARILFDTGCRIHETCSLTIGDWQESNFGREIRTINKGSKGQRAKTLYLSDRTVKVMHKYLYEERIKVDPAGLTYNALLALPAAEALATPLFLTSRGTPITPDDFRRRFWTPALAASSIKLRPHQVRHWFVTMAIQEIAETATGPEEMEKARLTLRQLMAWRSDMLPVYDQALRHLQLPQLATRIHARIEKRQQEILLSTTDEDGANAEVESETALMLKEMLSLS